MYIVDGVKGLFCKNENFAFFSFFSFLVKFFFTMPTSTEIPKEVIVHPLVLLSVVDHYNRVAQNTRKRVVGALLGQFSHDTVNVANSFAGKNSNFDY